MLYILLNIIIIIPKLCNQRDITYVYTDLLRIFSSKRVKYFNNNNIFYIKVINEEMDPISCYLNISFNNHFYRD